MDLKSSKELPESGSGITSSYEIIDGTTVHLDHNEPFEPTFVKENVQATVVSNGQNGVEILNSKLETKEQATSNEADFEDFVKSSENILDLPQISGIHSSPLNISAFSDKVEYPTTDVENKTLTNVEDNQFSDKIIDINNLQISTINGSKEESTIEKEKVTELNEEDNVSSSEEVVSNAPDVQSIRVTEQTKSVDIQSLENATSETQPHIRSAESSNEIKTDIFPPASIELITFNDTKSDKENIGKSDQIEVKDIQSPQNVTAIATSDTKLNEQHIENSDKVEMKDGRSSVIIATNDTKSNERSADSSDKIETKNIQSPQNVTIATSDIKSDEQSAENSEVETDVHSSINISIIAINDTKSDEDNAGSSEQIEVKDIQSSQNVTLIATTDTTTNAKSNNAENSDKIDIESFSLLENIKTRIKNLELQTEEHLELQVEPDDLRKVKESESIENLSKHDIEDDVNNKISVVTDTNNIEGKNIQFDSNIKQYKKIGAKSSSNIKNIISVENITSSIQYNLDTEDTMAITKETSENIFYRTEGKK